MSDTFHVTSTSFDKTLSVPTSKSYANRALILSSIFPGKIRLNNISSSSDVTAMINCLRAIGLEIIDEGNSIEILNSFPECEDSIEVVDLETGDGGTTNRFLIPLLSRGRRKYNINAKGHMRKRPMQDLLNSLNQLKVVTSLNLDQSPWISIKGPAHTEGTVEIPSHETTQFATGLYLAFANTSLQIIPLNMENSVKYFEMTLSLIDEFKSGKNVFEIPVDFSSLSYPLALALVHGNVTVSNYKVVDPFQADSIFLEIITEMGGKLVLNEDGLSLKKAKTLHPIDKDCSGFPDLVPTLAFVCSYCEGTSYLRNLEVLRHKESDRVEEILKILRAFGVQHEYANDTLIIVGGVKKSSEIDLTNLPADHRIIMMAYLFLRVNKGGHLNNYIHVNKSFKNFFEVMN
ncbi:MAG: hypothetical protein H6622_01700 [Halobacteriovoraceae bacterium]|nr:hypothetical protein [Halobacteriovoraceae bacterium]